MLPEKLKQLIQRFQSIQDRQDRIDALISLARQYRPPEQSTEIDLEDPAHRVPNCESDVHVWVLPPAEAVRLEFHVGNPQGISAQALAAILQKTLTGEAAEQIATIDERLVEAIFTRELSTGKSAGLQAMVAMVRAQARELARKN
jgi:sulfur transfer protein SufE